jgi:hypothetical protein
MAQNIFNNLSNFFGQSLRVFASVVFCLGIFLEGAWALQNQEERVEHYLTHYLKVEDLNSHKKIFMEMSQFRSDQDEIHKNKPQSVLKSRKNLVEDVIKKYHLDPNKKEDYCNLMERLVFYFAGIEDLLGTKPQSCSITKDGCIQRYPVLPANFDEVN